MKVKRMEFAIAAVTTGKIFPKIFKNKKDAERFRLERADPDHWKVVSRAIWETDWFG